MLSVRLAESIHDYQTTAEALETIRAQELAALSEERAAEIIKSLGAIDVWRERQDWSGLVEQQAIFQRKPKHD